MPNHLRDMAVPINEAVVLIAEDNPDNMFIAIELLRRAGVRYCNGRASGRQLFKVIASQDRRIDLILLDIHIPHEDGYVILKQIRETSNLRDTLVVAFTANVMVEDVERARVAGFDGFIGKPISHTRFPQQITRILQGEDVWEPR
jgi:two-component system cell cycle response regulator DivK